MSDPVWVRDDLVLSAHRRQLSEHGGAEGLRDEALLASALARPKNLLAYASTAPDLPALAAAYASGIIRNHPFVDSNKRTGYVICRTFLLLNGLDIEATKEEKLETFIAVAAGEISEEELASWLRDRANPL